MVLGGQWYDVSYLRIITSVPFSILTKLNHDHHQSSHHQLIHHLLHINHNYHHIMTILSPSSPSFTHHSAYKPSAYHHIIIYYMLYMLYTNHIQPTINHQPWALPRRALDKASRSSDSSVAKPTAEMRVCWCSAAILGTTRGYQGQGSC